MTIKKIEVYKYSDDISVNYFETLQEANDMHDKMSGMRSVSNVDKCLMKLFFSKKIRWIRTYNDE